MTPMSSNLHTPPDLTDEDLELSLQDAAVRLGVSPRYLDRLVSRGELPSRRDGDHVRIRLGDLDRCAAEVDRRAAAAAAKMTAEAQALGLYE
jgi:excisionase family DNA binding protein